MRTENLLLTLSFWVVELSC